MININGGFEDTKEFETSGWEFGLFNGSPKVNLELAENSASPWSRRSGLHSARMYTESMGENGCFDAVLWRKLNVNIGDLILFEGYNRIWCGETWGEQSDVNVNVVSQLGILLNDGGEIKWGEPFPNPHFVWTNPDSRDLLSWAYGAVSAVATTKSIQLFARSKVGWVGQDDAGGPPCRWPHTYMNSFWDDLAVSIVPGQPPAPPPSGKRILVDLNIKGTLTWQ